MATAGFGKPRLGPGGFADLAQRVRQYRTEAAGRVGAQVPDETGAGAAVLLERHLDPQIAALVTVVEDRDDPVDRYPFRIVRRMVVGAVLDELLHLQILSRTNYGSPVVSVTVVADSILKIDAAHRDAWVPLLELADEPVPLRAYLHDGTLFGVSADDTGRPRAATLVLDLGGGTAEMRAVAVSERDQGGGLGTWMVARVCDRLRAAGTKRVVVGTASSGVRQLAFYQRLGFRLSHIEPDFFTEAKGYPAGLSENGIATRDMVWMELML